MATTYPKFTARIKGPQEVIFNLIADMPNYGHWLPGSDAFGGTIGVKPYPVCMGTTYLDAGPAGKRPGSVTEYDFPKHISFHHTMLIKKGLLVADVDVNIRYTFEPEGSGTFVDRQLELTIKMNGLSKLAMPFVRYAFNKENVRILRELKRYVEYSSK